MAGGSSSARPSSSSGAGSSAGGPSSGAGSSSGAPSRGAGPSRVNTSRKTARDIRRERNLASAKASRQRKRESISALEQEHARLNEVNAMLRARLNISDGDTLSALQQLQRLPAQKPGVTEVGPALRKLAKKSELESKVLVDLLDRALSGGQGKGPPLDPDLCRAWETAMRRAPKDQPRPYQYVEKHGGMEILGPEARGRGTVSKGGPLAGPRPPMPPGDAGRGSSSRASSSKGASKGGSSSKR